MRGEGVIAALRGYADGLAGSDIYEAMADGRREFKVRELDI